MKNLETQEIRGINLKLIISVVGFLIALVVRDIRKENKIETQNIRIEANEKMLQALSTEADKARIERNTMNILLTEMKTTIDFLKTSKQ